MTRRSYVITRAALSARSLHILIALFLLFAGGTAKFASAQPGIRIPAGNLRAAQTPSDSATPVAAEGTPISLETVGLMDPDERPVDPITGAINDLIADEDGVYGVILMEPDGTLLYNRNSETPFVSASLYKLILIADICKAIQEGRLFLDTPLYVDWSYFPDSDGTDSYFSIEFAGYETTVEEALLATGAYSSNVAAHALLTLTSPEELNAAAQDLGLTGTFLFQDPTTIPEWQPVAMEDSTAADIALSEEMIRTYSTDGRVNLTTPRDMALFFQLLLSGDVVNTSVSKMIIEILQQQQITNRIPALLPPDTKTIHKTGNLDFVIHDVGIVYGPDGPVILVAMAQGQSNDDRAIAIEQRLGLIAYGQLDVPPMPEGTPIAGDGTGLYETVVTPVVEVTEVTE